ncbi:MAG: hypothetical protein K2J08_01040 [Ruminococcus sp.]|nr:hypothetical protein [Ruminococcus sp.]
MTQKEIILLMSYMRNNLDRLEDDVRQAKHNLHLSGSDSYDCMEFIRSTEYLHAFTEFTSDVRALLGLYGRKTESFCTYCRKCLFHGNRCEGFRCSMTDCYCNSCAYEKNFEWCFTPKK